MDQYQAMAEQKDYEPGKIFVGGLSWETTKESLQEYFEKYGEITDSVIMVEGPTKRPRGFGFVTFKDPASVEAVLSATTPHVLDTKTVDPKRAAKKGGSMGGAGGGGGGGGQQGCAKKVFVGGIANGTTEDDVRSYFGQFGQVINLDLKYDKVTQRMRGFGFVEFESEDVVEKLCQGHFHQLNGKTVEVKKAESRYASSQGFTQRGGAHQPYGGNIGRGGYNYGMGGGGGYGGNYGGYGYTHQQPQQQQQQQQQQYGGYGYGSYGSGQSGGYGQQAGSYDYSGYGSQQPASGSEQPRTDSSYYYAQQQQQYQDGTGYGSTPRTSYSTGTESYGQQATAYHYDTSTGGYTTADSQPSTGYGRGAGQQRGGTTYHYPSH